jgi:hypothetical protein
MSWLLYFFCLVAAVFLCTLLFSCARISSECSRRENWQDETTERERYLN